MELGSGELAALIGVVMENDQGGEAVLVTGLGGKERGSGGEFIFRLVREEYKGDKNYCDLPVLVTNGGG